MGPDITPRCPGRYSCLGVAFSVGGQRSYRLDAGFLGFCLMALASPRGKKLSSARWGTKYNKLRVASAPRSRGEVRKQPCIQFLIDDNSTSFCALFSHRIMGPRRRRKPRKGFAMSPKSQTLSGRAWESALQGSAGMALDRLHAQ